MIQIEPQANHLRLNLFQIFSNIVVSNYLESTLFIYTGSTPLVTVTTGVECVL